MPLPYHMQEDGPEPKTHGAEGTDYCIRCSCLMWEAESIWGYGLRCGCIKWAMLQMKQALKEVDIDVKKVLS